MANLFSADVTDRIPQDLKECTDPSERVVELSAWSALINRAATIVCGIMAVLSVIATIALTIEVGYESKAAAVAVFVALLLASGASIFVVYSIFKVLALLLDAFADISHHTMVTANVAVLDAASKYAPVPPKVSKSGKTTVATVAATAEPGVTTAKNATTVEVKHKEEEVLYFDTTPCPEGMWKCKYCGTNNKVQYGQCKRCAEHRSR